MATIDYVEQPSSATGMKNPVHWLITVDGEVAALLAVADAVGTPDDLANQYEAKHPGKDVMLWRIGDMELTSYACPPWRRRN
jgi:hypothetical protein